MYQIYPKKPDTILNANQLASKLQLNQSKDLAEAYVNSVIEKNLLDESKAIQISKRAFELWNNNVVKDSYTDLYNKILEK